VPLHAAPQQAKRIGAPRFLSAIPRQLLGSTLRWRVPAPLRSVYAVSLRQINDFNPD
jgi:hypothetical protein